MGFFDRWRAKEPSAPPSAEKPRTRIAPYFAESIAPAEKLIANPFAVAKPMPGVLPSATMAMDDNCASIASWGAGFGLGQGISFIGYPALAELSQRAEYRLISETFAKEMTRKWIKIQAMGDKSKSEKVKVITAALKKYGVRDAFRRVAELDGFFGRAHLYVDTGYTNNPDELKTPLLLDPAKIGLGSLKGIRVVEPIWTYPAAYNSTDPLRPDFYKPESWYVMGKELHGSRLLTFVGREMPDLLKPAYMFGGLSRTQMTQECVNFWLRDRDAVSDLVTNFSTPVLETDMNVALQDDVGNNTTGDPCIGGPGSGLFARVDAFNRFRNNRGAFVLNKDTESFGNVSTPLGSLDKLQAQSQEHICAVAKLPLIKYAGITPSGLNATSSDELRSFEDDIHAEQEDFFADNLEIVLKVIQLSELGEIDDSITYEFISLWTLDEAGKAAVQKIKADIDAVNITEGVVSQEEARKRQADDPESIYMGLDLSMPPHELPEGEAVSHADASEHIGTEGAEGSETGANNGA